MKDLNNTSKDDIMTKYKAKLHDLFRKGEINVE